MLREKKEELEKRILELVKEFEEAAGVHLSGIRNITNQRGSEIKTIEIKLTFHL